MNRVCGTGKVRRRLFVAGPLVFMLLLSLSCSAAERPTLSGQAAADSAPASASADLSGVSAETGETHLSRPVRIRIPSIGVDADMVPLGLQADGTIDVPSDFDETGWWADGPEPGEPGPAVVLGHVDSRDGPAVFFRLHDLSPSDAVVFDLEDGTEVTYVVERLEQHSKTEFPTEAVYGSTPDAQLRLVTCGGDFDSSRRSYDDNIIVYARLA